MAPSSLPSPGALCAGAVLSLPLLLTGLAAAVATPAAPATFAPDAAWCWFSDPRAIVHDGKLYAGWMTADGSVQVGARPLAALAEAPLEVATLAEKFEVDDHDHPSLLALPDGRIMAFYAAHAHGDLHVRTTLAAGDLGAWTPDRLLGVEHHGGGPRGVTYANPALLRDEGDALYVFWRGGDFKPTFAVSRDLGETWSAPRTLIRSATASHDNRPYVKYWNDGRGRIDFLFTDGHPRDERTNSVYFLRYEHGAFFKADGTRVGGMDDLPFAPAQCDRIYDGATAGRAWVWGITEDGEGRPVVAYTRLPAEDDHRYHWARWSGTAWHDTEITPAGGWFPQTPEGKREREPHYSGGMALDPRDPRTVFTSRRIGGHFEIEAWTTPDDGATWRATALTRDSAADNVRPFAVAAAPGRTLVLWMSNTRYVHYTDYATELRMTAWPAATPAGGQP